MRSAIELYARCARFYGFSDEEMRQMPWARLVTYGAWIRALQAEEMLLLLQVFHADPKELMSALQALARGWSFEEYREQMSKAKEVVSSFHEVVSRRWKK